MDVKRNERQPSPALTDDVARDGNSSELLQAPTATAARPRTLKQLIVSENKAAAAELQRIPESLSERAEVVLIPVTHP